MVVMLIANAISRTILTQLNCNYLHRHNHTHYIIAQNETKFIAHNTSYLQHIPFRLVQWISRSINGWFSYIVAAKVTLRTSNVLRYPKQAMNYQTNVELALINQNSVYIVDYLLRHWSKNPGNRINICIWRSNIHLHNI